LGPKVRGALSAAEDETQESSVEGEWPVNSKNSFPSPLDLNIAPAACQICCCRVPCFTEFSPVCSGVKKEKKRLFSLKTVEFETGQGVSNRRAAKNCPLLPQRQTRQTVFSAHFILSGSMIPVRPTTTRIRRSLCICII
jgi:hypothetical protein